MTKNKPITLTDIAHYLMLHGSFINNLGLLNGKMGIILFFYHYAKYTQCKRYEDFANCMMEEVYEEININSPKDFANGLSGISFGVSYLINNKFVKVDIDILDELDSKIMEWDVKRMSDYSLQTGLAGIGFYVLSRYNADTKSIKLPTLYINNVLESLLESNDKLCLKIYDYINNQSNVTECMKEILQSTFPGEKMTKHVVNIGIDNGIAGVALNKILLNNGKK